MAIIDRILRSGRTVSLAPIGGYAAKRGGAASTRALNMSMQQQQQTNWCWSAVSVSVRKFYTPADPITQCALANQQLSTTTCCADGSTAACNQAWYLNLALAGVNALNAMSSGTFSFANVKTEVNQDRPLGCRIGWFLGGGHFVCLDGYDSTSGTDYVTVRDPWYGTSTETYTNFATNYRSSGSWTHTYTTKP